MNHVYNDPCFKERRRFLRKEQTDVEKILWLRLRSRQVLGYKFYRQYGVDAYILDFYCPQVRLAIELDGGHHLEEETKEYDKMRTQFLEALNIHVLRFWNNEVLQNIEGTLQKIVETVEERITPPASSYSKRRF